MNSLDILKAREERSINISKYINDYNIVVMKVNMFGINKNNNITYSILRYFENILDNNDYFKNKEKEYFDSLDGPYIIYKFNKNIKNIKEETIKIEESCNIGRLIDLDVYINSINSISRGNKRKCIICNDYAYNCIRNKKHNYNELVYAYKDILFNSIKDIILDSITFSAITELKLDPKFGCVTINSNGSHSDLNYSLMVKCIDLLKPFFSDMFRVGFFEEDDYFSKINKIGRIAEKEMFSKLNSNCYKGLIFCLGIIITSMGIYLSSFNNLSFIDALKCVVKDVLFKENNTNGYKYYKEYGFGGIRKETNSYFKTVLSVYNDIDIDNYDSIYQSFIKIISLCEDTCLLKRAGSIDRYNYFKELICNIDINNKEEIDKVNTICLNNNISLGGSCDLLVCALFIKTVIIRLNLKEFI